MKLHNAQTLQMYTYGSGLFVILVVFGLVLDTFFPTNQYASSWWQPLGIILIIVGTLMALVAITSLRTIRNRIKKHGGVNMYTGVYTYMRHPDYVSYILLGFGLGFILQSVIVLGLSILFVGALRAIAHSKDMHLMSDDSPMRVEYTAYYKKVRRFF